MKKVLVIRASAHANGNSDRLAQEFTNGALASGNEVEIIDLRTKKIGHCLGCDYCRNHNGNCALQDDMKEVNQKMMSADVIAFAGPVYYYAINGMLKDCIDRTYAIDHQIKADFYYLFSSADPKETSIDSAVACMHGFARCMPKVHEIKTVYGCGNWKHGDIEGKEALHQAYQAGKNV